MSEVATKPRKNAVPKDAEAQAAAEEQARAEAAAEEQARAEAEAKAAAEAKAKEEAAEAEKKRFKQLVPQRRKLAEHARRDHVVTVEDASHPEDFLKSDFWALVAKELTPGDRIEVRDDALTYFGEFIVLSCDRTWAKVHALREVRLAKKDEVSVSPEYRIEYKGPHLKYCVIRVSDQSAVKEGCETALDANTWLVDYARLVGAKIVQ